MKEKIKLELTFNESFSPRELEENLIGPLERELEEKISVLLHVPGFRFEGNTKVWEPGKVDFNIYNLEDVKRVKSVLIDEGLFEKSKLKFRKTEDYNLFDYF